MPLTYDVDVDRRVVDSVASGEVTEADWDTHFGRLKADPRIRVGFRFVCDATDLTSLEATPELLHRLARARILFSGSRQVYIAPGDLFYGFARMIQTFAEHDGREIGVFRTRKEADAWLDRPAGVERG